MLDKPSFLAHLGGGFFMLMAIVVLIMNLKPILRLESYKLLIILGILSAVVTLHGISHILLESVYDFNTFSLFMKMD